MKIVLDIEDPEQFIEDLLWSHEEWSSRDFDKIAAQVRKQVPKPRIPEPGLWGVVEAGVKQHDVRLRWLRLGDNYRPEDSDEYDRLWSDLIDPVVIRDGI